MKDNLRSMIFPTTVAHSIQHNGGVKKMRAEWQRKEKWGWRGWINPHVLSLRMHLSLLFSDREKRSLHLPKRKEIGKSGERAGFPRLCWKIRRWERIKGANMKFKKSESCRGAKIHWDSELALRCQPSVNLTRNRKVEITGVIEIQEPKEEPIRSVINMGVEVTEESCLQIELCNSKYNCDTGRGLVNETITLGHHPNKLCTEITHLINSN